MKKEAINLPFLANPLKWAVPMHPWERSSRPIKNIVQYSTMPPNKLSAIYWDNTDSPWLLQLVLQTQMIRIRIQITEMQIERRLRGDLTDNCIKPSLCKKIFN
jgi:hypothetical protein